MGNLGLSPLINATKTALANEFYQGVFGRFLSGLGRSLNDGCLHLLSILNSLGLDRIEFSRSDLEPIHPGRSMGSEAFEGRYPKKELEGFWLLLLVVVVVVVGLLF